MTSVRRALALSLIERYLLIVISLLSNILLARLLTPEEIGLYSVSLAVIGIAQVLRDFGVGNFLIQEKHLSEAHIRTAFGFTLVIGIALFFITFFVAASVAQFYNDMRIVQTMRISSLNFLVMPFCTISLSLLRRDMAFKQIMVVSLLAALVGFCVTVSLAYAGFGANSIAVGAVATNIATGITAWLVRTKRQLLLPSFSEWHVILNFGGQNTLAGIVTTIAMDVNDLALGKILGFAPVAMYSRAQGLMNLFHRDVMTAVKGVAFPAFAKAHRDGESLEESYIKSVTVVTVIAWPFYGFTALYALELLRLLFGPQWDEAVPLVPMFCLAGASLAASSLVISAVMAVGRIDLVTKSELTFQPLRAILIVLFALTFKSLVACAVAFLAAFLVYTPFVYFIKAQCIPNNYKCLLSNLWVSAKVTLFALVLPAMLSIYAGVDRVAPASFFVVISAIILCGLSWVGALFIFKHPVTIDPLFKRVTHKFNSFIW
ncbi:lipopolysaccharide biosynthesis protein [Chromatium okenii]|uniref:lipopolysaccharide biosynthesis protein n=1 Tax=Chromatium okenii TaxID=61644 RepID=UPI0026EBA6CF|nr:lipopolysaccharide biosynthesis protein [Chromatium okenii]MBV5307784.1 lipopolysaccharide biosynthesis protein [Chromatium okenii]